jgi:hypothetical protein
MSGAPIAALAQWHDFYMLIGTAAATLVGLTCVAASVGASIFTEESEKALQSFLTPTVVHFAAVLFAALLTVAPFTSVPALGTSLFPLGATGILYSSSVWLNVRGAGYATNVLMIDRMWYGLAPVIGYGVVAAASVALALGIGRGLVPLAGGLCLLMIAGIRNAWDMTLWIVIRTPTPPRS